MSAGPPGYEAERFRHWITSVEISPEDTDPDCKFSARLFIDRELVCNLPQIDHTRACRWSGLLRCDVSAPSKASFRLCRTVKDKPRYFNFPPFFLSEADEETGESTLELPQADSIITIKSLTPMTAGHLFPDELEKLSTIGGVYDSLEPSGTIKYLFKNALLFASFVAEALPDSTAKVSFLICMKAWELLDQQNQLDDAVQANLRGLIRIRDIVDVARQASSSMLTTAMGRSKEAIEGILALLEDISVYIFNRYATNDLSAKSVGAREITILGKLIRDPREN